MRIEKIIIPDTWSPNNTKAINKWFKKITKTTKYNTKKSQKN